MNYKNFLSKFNRYSKLNVFPCLKDKMLVQQTFTASLPPIPNNIVLFGDNIDGRGTNPPGVGVTREIFPTTARSSKPPNTPSNTNIPPNRTAGPKGPANPPISPLSTTVKPAVGPITSANPPTGPPYLGSKPGLAKAPIGQPPQKPLTGPIANTPPAPPLARAMAPPPRPAIPVAPARPSGPPPSSTPPQQKKTGSHTSAGLLEFFMHPLTWDRNNGYFNVLLALAIFGYGFCTTCRANGPDKVSYDVDKKKKSN